MRSLVTLARALGLAGAAPPAPSRWWMDEPVRLLQANLRETDSGLDVQRLAGQVADFPANVLLFNMGGIVAQYPTRVALHFASPHLSPGPPAARRPPPEDQRASPGSGRRPVPPVHLAQPRCL